MHQASGPPRRSICSSAAAKSSSTILSRSIDVTQFGLIYAGAQKNVGPAGLTLVIVRDDLIGDSLAGTPAMFQYATHAENGSMCNTPPTYGWYLAGLVFQWLKDLGGLDAMAQINERKAKALYCSVALLNLFRSTLIRFSVPSS